MVKSCSHSGCHLPLLKGTYCNAHYIRSRRGKDMDAPVRRSGSDPKRFWDKADRSAPDECWEWNAYRDPAGYGRFMVDRIPRLAHRESFERANGPIPAGLEVDHVCHNPGCVNPAHLRLATGGLNRQNLAGARRDSSSGVRGVRRRGSKWSAEATVNGKRVNLGRFDSIQEAEAVVTEWRRMNMPYSAMDQEAS